MKIQGAKKVHYDSGPNMTPLVDVVMVILIFLMLTGSFGGASHFLFGQMPVSKEGKGEIKEGINDKKNIEVEIRENRISGAIEAIVDNTKPGYAIPNPKNSDELATGLVDALKAKRQAFINAGVKEDDIQVLIAPSNEVAQRVVMKVYEAAFQAQFKAVGFKLPQS